MVITTIDAHTTPSCDLSDPEDTKPILTTEETITTTTTTVTKTRKTYVTPSPSPSKALSTKASKVAKPSKQLAILPTLSKKSSTVSSLSSTSPSSPSSSRHAPAARPSLVPSFSASPPRRAFHFQPAGVNPVRTIHPVPHPDEIRRPAAGENIQGYYVVFRGRECGIFYTWDEDDIRTTNHPNQCQQKFRNWDAALTAYTASYDRGEIIATPDPNTRWWTEPIRIGNMVELADDTSTSSEEALWANFSDDDDTAAWVELQASIDSVP